MFGTFIAGCVASVFFPQFKLPILATSASYSAINSWVKQKDNQNSQRAVVGLSEDEIKQGNQTEGERKLAQFQKVTLAWDELNVTLEKKKKKENKKGGTVTNEEDSMTMRIVKDAYGIARSGRLLAIIGPSGSGKTTLINALSSHIPKDEAMHVTGELLWNGSPVVDIDYIHVREAYVRQQSLFFSHLTVQETLDFSASLRLPKHEGYSDTFRNNRVEHLISSFGLVKCRDTIIGNDKMRGISGGEMKRLTLACELLRAPAVIFADEPTTGLDSFQAQQVMQILKDLAEKEGHTVICSIHQPRYSIYAMFDDILMLSEGQTMYVGPTNDALAFFEKQGLICPPQCNPAEFFSDMISIDYSSKESEARSRERVKGLAEAMIDQHEQNMTEFYEQEGQMSEAQEFHDDAPKTSSSWVSQFVSLFKRAWKQVTRDKATFKARLIPSIMSAIMFGCIYWRMQLDQTGVQDRLGLLQVCTINTAMLSLTKTLNVFPKERTIVDRERSSNGYGVLPYILSKLAAELPIGAIFPGIFGTIVFKMAGFAGGIKGYTRFIGLLTASSFASSSYGLTIGALAKSTETALAIGPASMVLFIIFGGYYVNTDTVPAVLRWLPNVSLIRWCFEGLAINEFSHLTFDDPSAKGGKLEGSKVLNRLGFENIPLSVPVLYLTRIILFNYATAYAIVTLKKPKFCIVEQPEDNLNYIPIRDFSGIEGLDQDTKIALAAVQDALVQMNSVVKNNLTLIRSAENAKSDLQLSATHEQAAQPWEELDEETKKALENVQKAMANMNNIVDANIKAAKVLVKKTSEKILCTGGIIEAIPDVEDDDDDDDTSADEAAAPSPQQEEQLDEGTQLAMQKAQQAFEDMNKIVEKNVKASQVLVKKTSEKILANGGTIELAAEDDNDDQQDVNYE